MTNQPIWKCVANLGDVNPIDYGGVFVYVDQTGVYAPEMEVLETNEDDNHPQWTTYRVVLERCTLTNGVLSANPYHPECATWFAKPENERDERPQDTTYLSNVADYVGQTLEELQTALCSADPVERAPGYLAVGRYHGWYEFDEPNTFTDRAEVENRYKYDLQEIKAK